MLLCILSDLKFSQFTFVLCLSAFHHLVVLVKGSCLFLLTNKTCHLPIKALLTSTAKKVYVDCPTRQSCHIFVSSGLTS